MSAGKGSGSRNCHSKQFKDNYDNIFNKRKEMKHETRPKEEVSSPVDGKVDVDFHSLPKCQQEMQDHLLDELFKKRMNEVLRDE